MNDTIEILFKSFLDNLPAGELADEMHRISAELDRQIEAGIVDADLVGEYELAATRYGFYAGFLAAQGLQAAKIRLAYDRLKEVS